MKTLLKLILCALLLTLCTAFCYGQSKSNPPKDNLSTDNANRSKLLKTQSTNSSGNVHCGLQDRKGNLWFATTGDGVFRYDGASFTNFTTKDGLNSNGVYALYEDKKGNIWFGTDKGICWYDGKTIHSLPIISGGNYINLFTNKPTDKPTTTLSLNSIMEDRNGKFWFGAEQGVYCYDGKTLTRFVDPASALGGKGLDPRSVLCMIEDRKGNIWFTTRAEGIYRFDGRTLHNYKPNNETWLRGLCEDKDGNIWIGRRYKGVFRYDGKTFASVLQHGAFDSCAILNITRDKKGNLWFAAETSNDFEGGVWRYDGKTFQHISKKDDLQHHGTWFILEDTAGNFWIGTRSMGLYRYDGKTFTRFSE